ncbi:MAG: T9SS type A sorting domain-containing protein, partial [Flavobacteriales bacterium]|nr:T9SS type A sorting domain-containing protein [Flavobacteriales bacterium]
NGAYYVNNFHMRYRVYIQIDAFGAVDTTNINNLAGKYRANFGTPFDLEELINEPNLDINSISHVKIIDVIGSIDSNFCNYDQNLNIINDPFPTPFPSSGFDLDAVGVINQGPLNIILENSTNIIENFRIINGMVVFDLKSVQKPGFKVEIFDLAGKIIFQKNYKYNLEGTQNIDVQSFKNGIYLLNISTTSQSITRKFVVKY